MRENNVFLLNKYSLKFDHMQQTLGRDGKKGK